MNKFQAWSLKSHVSQMVKLMVEPLILASAHPELDQARLVVSMCDEMAYGRQVFFSSSESRLYLKTKYPENAFVIHTLRTNGVVENLHYSMCRVVVLISLDDKWHFLWMVFDIVTREMFPNFLSLPHQANFRWDIKTIRHAVFDNHHAERWHLTASLRMATPEGQAVLDKLFIIHGLLTTRPEKRRHGKYAKTEKTNDGP